MTQIKDVEIFRIVAASPNDVQAERDSLPSVINELNLWVGPLGGLRLELLRWETEAFPAFHSDGPQGHIDSRLNIQDCDLFIGIFWKKFGTPVDDAKSGTEHEFKLAYEAWKVKTRPQIMFYFNQKAYKPNSREEIDQWGQVLEFQNNFPKEGLWWPYKGASQFEDLVRKHLTKIVLDKIMSPSEGADKAGSRGGSPASNKQARVSSVDPDKVGNGKLILDLVNVYGNHLEGKVSIHYRNSTLHHYGALADVDASKKLIITGLYTHPHGHYWIQVNSSTYFPAGRFVAINTDGSAYLRMMLPINSKRVKRANFPRFGQLHEDLKKLLKTSNNVVSFEGRTGKDLYDALDDLRKANLLNLAAKAAMTLLKDGKSVLAHLQKLKEIKADHMFAFASKELLEQTEKDASDEIFRSVAGSLHYPPASIAGSRAAGSFKTSDYYGELQLTFYLNEDGCIVDLDIDDGNGAEHIFQLLRGSLWERNVNAFDIHEILVAHQAIDPGYTLSV